MTKATKAAFDDLTALINGIRDALTAYQVGNPPQRSTLEALADKARSLARRRSTTLLGSIVIEDTALAQTRENFNQIAEDITTAANITRVDLIQPLLAQSLQTLNRALSEVPKPKPILQQLREKIGGILRTNQNPVTQPTKPKPILNVPSILAKAQAKYKEQSAALAKKLVAGELTVEYWRQDMMRAIRDLHYTAAVAGAGGIGYLTPKALATIDEKVREQGTYLNRWANQLEQMRQDQRGLNETQLTIRANMYAGAAQAMASEAADTVTYGQFPKLPCYPVDGLTLCRSNCRCKDWRWDILDAEAGSADVYYILDPAAESCGTCLYRAEVFSPLQIRDFRIITEYDRNKILHR